MTERRITTPDDGVETMDSEYDSVTDVQLAWPGMLVEIDVTAMVAK
jgi:hypothetical protein